VALNRRSATRDHNTPSLRGLKSTATIMASLREAGQASRLVRVQRSNVSQNCTLPDVGGRRCVGPIQRSAEYNSAIQQIENLRYESIPAAS